MLDVPNKLFDNYSYKNKLLNYYSTNILNNHNI